MRYKRKRKDNEFMNWKAYGRHEKLMKRFLKANQHDPNRIERLQFKNVAQKEI